MAAKLYDSTVFGNILQIFFRCDSKQRVAEISKVISSHEKLTSTHFVSLSKLTGRSDKIFDRLMSHISAHPEIQLTAAGAALAARHFAYSFDFATAHKFFDILKIKIKISRFYFFFIFIFFFFLLCVASLTRFVSLFVLDVHKKY
jgi:hypothetical protein